MSRSSFEIFGFASAEISASSRHPNELRLKGTLVRLDEPSTKAPHGSNGHRILVTSAVAKKRLDTLLNMGLNYAPSLKEHAARRKVGVITRAWIEGKNLMVEATVWKKDFPEAERDLKRIGLGMSMEISQVQVEDQDAAVWVLSDFVFTGATVLEKTSAAYFKTDAIAAAAANKKENPVKTKKKVVPERNDDELVTRCVAASVKAVNQVLKPFARTAEALMTRFDAMEAAAAGDEDDDVEDIEAEEDEEMDAKGKKADMEDDEESDDEDDIDSEIDTGDEEELGPEEDVEEDKPGRMNKNAKNKGRKTASEDKVGKTVTSARLAASLGREKVANRQIAVLTAGMADLKRQMKTMSKQVTAAAETQGRRSQVMPQEVQTLLRKGGIEPKDLQASGEKLTVEQVDAVFEASSTPIPNVKRIELKDIMRAQGLMEDGVVNRQR